MGESTPGAYAAAFGFVSEPSARGLVALLGELTGTFGNEAQDSAWVTGYVMALQMTLRAPELYGRLARALERERAAPELKALSQIVGNLLRHLPEEDGNG